MSFQKCRSTNNVKCGCSKFLRLPHAALQMDRTWAELFIGDVEPKTRHQVCQSTRWLMVLPSCFLIYWTTMLMGGDCGRQIRSVPQIKTRRINKIAELMPWIKTNNDELCFYQGIQRQQHIRNTLQTCQ